jgi:3-hydroxy-9,10-secoandrosta-1,3,5(10)-triene-9,17-dione monooxygenase
MGTFGFGLDVDEDLVGRAAALGPLLAQHAARTEAAREVVPEVIDAIEQEGLFDVLTPKRVGGLGATLQTQLAVAAELGRACPSSAWVQTLLNVATWGAARSAAGVGLFDDDGDRRRARVCGVLAPSGTATPTAGGYIVSGRWPFASGSFHASWFSGGVMVVDEDGDVVGPALALIPREQFTIEDTWFVAGMCGTASSTVVAEDAFVPAHRIALIGDEVAVGDDPADLWPLGSVLALVLIGPLLGAARGCADAVIEKAPGRAISYTTYASTTDSMVAISEVSRARLDIDSGWLHAFQAAAYVDAVGAGAPRDTVEEARLRAQCGYVTDLLRRGVDRLLTVAGAGSFASSSAVQRYWRDLNVGSRHAFLSTNAALETYGRALYGQDPIYLVV